MGVDGPGPVLAGASDRLGSQHPGQDKAVEMVFMGEEAWPTGAQGACCSSLVQHLL